MAFGTGTHPTTRMCLGWIAAHEADIRGQRVLDYGCGSGILAIAALKLGAAHAEAVDIDPQALLACRENAALNGVAGRLSCADVAQTDEQAVDEPVDLVLANILARPLVELAPLLARRVKCGGAIVLAGITQSQADWVREAYAPWFALQHDAARDEWVRVAGIRKA
jgi:ribosomal protein L11 methyltransferase